VQPGGVAVSYTANLQSIANNTAVALGMANFGFALIAAGGAVAMYAINGTLHTTTEVFDPSGVFSGAAGTASSWNVYWSAANNRYELENRRGSTATARIWLLDAA
jgi:Kef-type K+ transport system membrane component KefB